MVLTSRQGGQFTAQNSLAGVSVGCTSTCWCCHLVGPHEHSSATALCPSSRAFYSSLALIHILTIRPDFVAIKLFLELGSVKAVMVTGFTHSLCQACLSQARIKGSSSKLLNSDGPHILTLSRVHFVPVEEKRSAQRTNNNGYLPI